MEMHATFVLKCRLCMQQCNVMESCTMFMTFFPIFVILIFYFFFVENTYWLFFKDVITHATSSYFFVTLFGNSFRVYVLLDSVTWQFGVMAMEPFDI